MTEDVDWFGTREYFPFNCELVFILVVGLSFMLTIYQKSFSFLGCLHGTCAPSDEGSGSLKPWTCQCKEGWKGMLCNTQNSEDKTIPKISQTMKNQGCFIILLFYSKLMVKFHRHF